VNVPIRALHSVIDDHVLVVFTQPIVGLQFIGEDGRARLNVLADLLLQLGLAPIIDNEGSHVAATFQRAHDNSLVFAASAGDDTSAFPFVHVPCLAADEGFIDLVAITVSANLSTVLALLCKSDSVKHEPCGLLSDTERPRNLATTDPVLTVQDQPHCRKNPSGEGRVDIWSYDAIYAALGLTSERFADWEGRYGMDSLGVGTDGSLFIRGFPVFSKVAWIYIDPVDVSDSETRELIVECERALANTNDASASEVFRQIRDLALEAIQESATLRFGHP
jgi:hypothetical protein